MNWRCFLVSSLLCCAGCITPNLAREAGVAEIDLQSFPPGARVIEARVADGSTLRGVFVPARGTDEAPVLVLHFLASACSLSSGAELSGLVFDIHAVYFDMANAGAASLVFDWRGVGASEGEPDSRHLLEDARAAYASALGLTGGDATRVILRGTSLGALAAAALLEDGACPRAAVLIAPVCPETVARRWLSNRVSPLVAWLVAPFLRRPMDLDLRHALNSSRVPLLVFAGQRDDLVDDAERFELRTALEHGGGRWIEHPLDHEDLVLASGKLFPEERELVMSPP